jgi:hypothetical protein
MMTRTTTRPEPERPPVTPQVWPPERSAVGDHFRRNLAWYVLGASLLTLAGTAWTIAEVRALRQSRGAAERDLIAKENR